MNKIKLLLAPLMGITNSVFRNTYAGHFSGFDYAVTPFINIGDIKNLKKNILNELIPENNIIPVIPQILTNNPENFINLEEKLYEKGFKEINWNLGCPFPRVVNKKRGSGFLPYTDEIESFLDKTMKKIKSKLSIKVRIGFKSAEDIIKLIPVFNNYPIDNITIHPRTGKQMYTGKPDLDIFEECLKLSKHKIIYNGDIYNLDDYKNLKKRFPKINTWMIGRGALINPLLPEIIKNITKKEIPYIRIKNFHDELKNNYLTHLSGEKHVVDKMKEIMGYLVKYFDNHEKEFKKIRKSKNLGEYNLHINNMFSKYLY